MKSEIHSQVKGLVVVARLGSSSGITWHLIALKPDADDRKASRSRASSMLKKRLYQMLCESHGGQGGARLAGFGQNN